MVALPVSVQEEISLWQKSFFFTRVARKGECLHEDLRITACKDAIIS